MDVGRTVIRSALRGVAAAIPEPNDADLLQPAGCFVSLHALATHELRGCVGRIDASKPLFHAVRHAAVNVLTDPRFAVDPVRLDELPSLEIELSVLSPPRPVAGPLDFDPLEHGLHLTIGRRAGCFLPQVARETGWGREQLLSRLCAEKLGLSANAWRQRDARLSVFTTLIIGPEPFDLPEPEKAREFDPQ